MLFEIRIIQYSYIFGVKIHCYVIPANLGDIAHIALATSFIALVYTAMQGRP